MPSMKAWLVRSLAFLALAGPALAATPVPASKPAAVPVKAVNASTVTVHRCTDARGQVRIDGLPDGEYRLKAWHHQLANLDVPAEQMVAARGDTPALTLRLEMKAGAR